MALPEDIDDTSLTCPGFESQETYGGSTAGPVTIFSYQRYKFRLYRIASSITSNIYCRSGATLKEVVRRIKSLNRRLLQWEKCIPRELRLECLNCVATDEKTQSTMRTFQLQALVLQLSYDNIQLVLHRPLLTMNRVPRWPLNAEYAAHDVYHSSLGSSADEANDMIKSSKCQCWVSALRTSTIGDYANILVVSRSTYGAGYGAIQSFTAGVVLGIFALADPLSDQAHQAKRAVAKVIKLPKLHKYRTTVSDQCGRILEELLRLILAEETKALLIDVDASSEVNRGNHSNELNDSHNPSNGDSHVDDTDPGTPSADLQQRTRDLSQETDLQIASDPFQPQLGLPVDIGGGNFSDALLSFQNGKYSKTGIRLSPNHVAVFREGRGGLQSMLQTGPRSQISAKTTPMANNAQHAFSQSQVDFQPRMTNPFDVTTQAWIWDDWLWLPGSS